MWENNQRQGDAMSREELPLRRTRLPKLINSLQMNESKKKKNIACDIPEKYTQEGKKNINK